MKLSDYVRLLANPAKIPIVCKPEKNGSCFRTMAHLRRDETAPKMGHPDGRASIRVTQEAYPDFPHFPLPSTRAAPLLRLALLPRRAYAQMMPDY